MLCQQKLAESAKIPCDDSACMLCQHESAINQLTFNYWCLLKCTRCTYMTVIVRKLRPSVMHKLWPRCKCTLCNFPMTVPWTRPLYSNLNSQRQSCVSADTATYKHDSDCTLNPAVPVRYLKMTIMTCPSSHNYILLIGHIGTAFYGSNDPTKSVKTLTEVVVLRIRASVFNPTRSTSPCYNTTHACNIQWYTK